MRLQFNRVIGSGTPLLDQGITDLQTAVINGTVHLYSTTGRNGGIVDYLIGATGQIQVSSTVIFPMNQTALASDRLAVIGSGTGQTLIFAQNGTGMLGYGLGTQGHLGAQVNTPIPQMQSQSAGGSFAHLEAMIAIGQARPSVFPASVDCRQFVEIESVTLNGQTLVVAACQAVDGVIAFVQNAANGTLTPVGVLGAASGLGVAAPTAVEVAQIGGQTYIILAGAGSSSLSVMRLGADGVLTPTDHVIDTGATRFQSVQALAVAEVQGQVLVVAGGADDGLTLFALLPDGTLLALQTIADSTGLSMERVTALATAVTGTLLNVFVGSQNDLGVTQFTLDLGTLGSVLRGTAAAEVLTGTPQADILMAQGAGDTLNGGAGDDILISGDGVTRMTGGAGRDVFVVRPGATQVVITDFNPAEDRLDLSYLPMLRSPAQVSLTPTATGAVLGYRGTTITVTASNEQPLTLARLFPNGFDWADRFSVDWVVVGSPGLERTGGAGNDLLQGGDGADTLIGAGGDDTLEGRVGNDFLDGGDGNDILNGGAGDDTLIGAAGNDRLNGGAGNDHLSGGPGADLLQGGNGDDTLVGGSGNDTLRGGAGDDHLSGDDGNDLLNGEAGNDTLVGGGGNDTLRGAAGDDHLSGDDGNDLLNGHAGHDTLLGGAGNDTLRGGQGRDSLVGGDGNDRINSGPGNDTAFGGAGNDTIFGGDGMDWISGGAGEDQLFGDAGADTLFGDGGNDTLYGGEGNDALFGGDGDDMIFGGLGNDTLRGGAGNDTLFGGVGADVFEFHHDPGRNMILDFRPGQGDRLRLDDWIWNSHGTLSAQEVIDQFAVRDADGNVVLDFSSVGGAIIVLDGFGNLSALAAQLDIF